LHSCQILLHRRTLRRPSVFASMLCRIKSVVACEVAWLRFAGIPWDPMQVFDCSVPNPGHAITIGVTNGLLLFGVLMLLSTRYVGDIFDQSTFTRCGSVDVETYLMDIVSSAFVPGPVHRQIDRNCGTLSVFGVLVLDSSCLSFCLARATKA